MNNKNTFVYTKKNIWDNFDHLYTNDQNEYYYQIESQSDRRTDTHILKTKHYILKWICLIILVLVSIFVFALIIF
jgi:uncharacterized membrane protein YukC